MEVLWNAYGAARQLLASNQPAARLAPAHPRRVQCNRGGRQQLLINSKTDKGWNASSDNQDGGRKC